jgi:hypothetical protein
MLRLLRAGKFERAAALLSERQKSSRMIINLCAC